MRLAIGAFLLGATLTMTGTRPVLAASQDYIFEIVQPKIQESNSAIISVRLMSKVSGKPVTDAVIFQTRLDMSPDNMGDMATKVTPLASSEPGVHRFRADLSMTGRWALKLAAKVPGEQETVRGEVVVTATE
jgi:YtkA-like